MKKQSNQISLYWKCQLIGWAVNSLNIGILNWVLWGFGTDEILKMSVSFISGLTSTHMMRSVIVKLNIMNKVLHVRIFNLICLILFFSFFDSFLWLASISIFDSNYWTYPNFWGRFLQLYSGVFDIFLIWSFIYFMYHYVKEVRRIEQAKALMQIKIFDLESQALRASMNPHFIFNCMNSIKALMQEKETEKGIIYLTTFSKLIRNLFNSADKKEISLFDEIETCKLYLQLEAMRFDTKFSYSVNIDDNIDLKSIQVPALIIQPFIENAIWHGIVPRNNGGKVSLNVLRMDDSIEVVIEDDGIGREASAQNKSVSGFAHQSKGVNLTQSRLELNNLLQKRQAELEVIDKKDGKGEARGTKVIITLKEEA